MKIVTPLNIGLRWGSKGHKLEPGQRIVLDDFAAAQIEYHFRKEKVCYRISSTRHYERPYRGDDLRGKTLVTQRGAGAGDQMIWMGLLRIIARRNPGCRIIHHCHPHRAATFWGGVSLPEGIEVRSEPILWETWKSADYHLTGEGLVEADQEPDQPDIWTGHLLAAGIDPESVPPEERRPVVPISRVDEHLAEKWMKRKCGDRPLIVWQLSATSAVRTYDPNLNCRAIELVSQALPDALIALSDSPKKLMDFDPPRLPNVTTTAGLPLRAVFALIRKAACVVCPDSCFGHVAAAFDIPCVSLWGSFLPGDRVRWYPSHRPLVGKLECSPCRHHDVPGDMGCPRGRGFCEALMQIAPEKIADAVQEIVR